MGGHNHKHDHSEHNHSHNHSEQFSEHGHDQHVHSGHNDSEHDNPRNNHSAHDHSGHHSHEDREQSNVQKRLKIASALCALFILVEVIGGILAGSLTVLSDAAHLLADLASFIVALAASHYASKPASETYTFGFKRVEALAALFSVSSLALLSLLLAVEGLRRIWLFAGPFVFPTMESELPEVNGRLMSGIATIGVLVNVALAFVLGEEGAQFHGHSHDHDHAIEEESHKETSQHATETTSLLEKHHACSGHSHGQHEHSHEHSQEHSHEHHSDEEQSHSHELVHADELPPSSDENSSHSHHVVKPQRNINLHAAYLHVLGDLLQSISVLIAGIVIWIRPTWRLIDPLCTILFCMIVLRSTFGTFKSSLSVLMEEVPPHLSWSTIYHSIQQLPGVYNVHDLHIWSVSHGRPALSVHVHASNPQQALVDISNLCHSHKIDHATIQVQSSESSKCISCSIGEGQHWKQNSCLK